MTRPFKYILLLGVVGVFFTGCRDFSFSSFMRGDALASVGDKKLYVEDVQALFTAGMPPEDSLRLLQSYVDVWIKQQLKIQQAEKTFPEEQERITRMVNDYRNSLLIFEYEKQYLDNHLDTLVAPQEIDEYYQAHAEEFKLTVPLVKGLVVRFPVGFRQEGQMRLMASSGNPDRLQDMVDMALKNGFSFREFNDWTEASELISFLPRLSEQENARMLSASPLFETTQGDNRYFVVVTSVLQAGAPMPVDRATENIRNLIITRRKQELVRRLEESLYQSALNQKEITIQIDTLVNTNQERIEE